MQETSAETVCKIAIYASGTGSNAEAIIHYFRHRPDREVALVVSDKAEAPVLQKSRDYGIATEVLGPQQVKDGLYQVQLLNQYNIDFIALAGYMRLVPKEVIQAFPKRMVNIHPSLLPKYGGKGMYGMRVHQAVLANQEPETGITIQWVGYSYDEGAIIAQEKLEIAPEWGPEELKAAVHQLEWKNYPPIIDRVIREELENKR